MTRTYTVTMHVSDGEVRRVGGWHVASARDAAVAAVGMLSVDERDKVTVAHVADEATGWLSYPPEYPERPASPDKCDYCGQSYGGGVESSKRVAVLLAAAGYALTHLRHAREAHDWSSYVNAVMTSERELGKALETFTRGES